MENFLYHDEFFTELGDLIEHVDLSEDDIRNLPDDYTINIEETTREKIFILDQKFIIDAIMDRTERFDDRFPEESDSTFKRIEEAIKQSISIDIDKLNNLLPDLYYGNGTMTKITKQHLLDYIN